ncbi:AAA family ATPase [Streptomyces sp. NPDC005393]|uniref:ATP-binding protein n=1 Tax=Streptomyces sp. NPDC005393 TaxID=3157041 RepID=UPI0033A8232A
MVRLRLIGSFRIEGDPLKPIPAGKAGRLLTVLAAHPGQFLPLSLLIEALWADGPPDKADRNIAALISRLRRSLGRQRIEGGPGGYRLITDESLTVDLAEAERYVRTAEREQARGVCAVAATAAASAAGLLAADKPLANEPDAPWVHEVRQVVDGLLRRARACSWTAALEMGEVRTAVEAASAALTSDPFDEDACRAVMRAYRLGGESGAALAAYERLRSSLAEDLGANPAPVTQALYLSVLRGEPPSTPSRAIAGRPRTATSSLVGRDTELQSLLDRWSEAVLGHGQVVLLVGESGVGKSSLTSALARQVSASGALVVTTGCFEAERSLFLQPFVEALRSVIAWQTPQAARELFRGWNGPLSELVPEVARLIGPVNYERYERGTPETEHRRALEALAAVLGRLTESHPVLLIIEELQHAGQSTIEALHFLTTRVTGCRLLILGTLEAAEAAHITDSLEGSVTRIGIGPLSRAAVRTLAMEAGLPVDADWLYEWTGGSPYYVTELLRPGHELSAAGHIPPEHMPTSLRDAVARRISHAGRDVGLLLQLGAILGVAFSLDDVAALGDLGVEECIRRAEKAQRAGLLEPSGETFRFSGHIIRKVAYDSASEPVRISRHRRAAKLLAAQPEAAAHQLVAAGDWAPAVEAWLRAADAAHLAFSNLEAERLLTEALASATRSGDRRLLASVRLRRGQVRADLGRYDAAREDLSTTIGLARELGDEGLEARSLEQLGWTALYARDALAAVDLASRASHLAESAAAAPGALPSSLLLLGRVRHWDGDYAEAAEAYEQVLSAQTDEATKAMALAQKGAMLQHLDRFVDARRVLERAVLLCQGTGLLRPLLQSLFFTALARGDAGDFTGGLRALERARRLIDAAGVTYYRAGIDTAMSWLWRELGEVGRAREIAERAIESTRRGDALELEQEMHARLALADCDLVLGREDDAAAQVAAAVPLLQGSMPFRPRAELRLLEMQARWDTTAAESLLQTARNASSTKYEALALWHLERREEAARTALLTGSDLVVASVGTSRDAQQAVERISQGLPAELRSSFVAHGRLPLLVRSR